MEMTSVLSAAERGQEDEQVCGDGQVHGYGWCAFCGKRGRDRTKDKGDMTGLSVAAGRQVCGDTEHTHNH